VKSDCRQVEPLLDELVDDTLDEPRARAARAHLRECPGCAAAFEASKALATSAQTLGSLDPPGELWKHISQRLDTAELEAERRPRLWWWWHAWRRTLLASGGALAAAAITLGVWLTSVERAPLGPTLAELLEPPVSADALYDEAVAEVNRAERDYLRAIEELREVAAEERRDWSPEAARAFDENLAAIDAAIQRQAEAFGRAPGDVAALDNLHAMYRKKIDFLQESVVRGSL
jgi:hypothetical protein